MELIIEKEKEQDLTFHYGDIVTLNWNSSYGLQNYIVVPHSDSNVDKCALLKLDEDNGVTTAFGYSYNLDGANKYVRNATNFKLVKIYKREDYVLKLERKN